MSVGFHYFYTVAKGLYVFLTPRSVETILLKSRITVDAHFYINLLICSFHNCLLLPVSSIVHIVILKTLYFLLLLLRWDTCPLDRSVIVTQANEDAINIFLFLYPLDSYVVCGRLSMNVFFCLK